MDNYYEQWEQDLKDLLGWLQKAVFEAAQNQSTANVTSIVNARTAIFNHCKQLDRKRKQQYGIL